MPWTKFWDMHSGGGQKENWSIIYIEVPEEEAIVIFYNRFGHNPNRVTCTCCGPDYSISEYPTLEEASGFHRGCHYDNESQKYVEKLDKDGYHPYKTLKEYSQEEEVLIIYAKDIRPDEKEGDVPEEGYVWI